jgi:hypothetical protein
MFVLRAAVLRNFGAYHEADKTLFGSAVIFPDVFPLPRIIMFEPWEAIGRLNLSFSAPQ